MPESQTTCELCKLPGQLNAIAVGLHWTVNIAQDAKTRPWLVIQSKRHVDTFGDLTKEELLELGLVEKKLIAHLETFSQVHRAHIHYLNETQPSHVHLHITVSTLQDCKDDVTFLLGVEWPEDLRPINPQEWIPQISASVYHKREPSFFVRTLVKIAQEIQRLNFIYPAISKGFKRIGKDPSYAAELYVFFSLLLFISGFILSTSHQMAGLIFSVLGFLRIVDIWSTQLAILLNRQAKLLKGFERTLVLAVFNCIELAAIAAIWGSYFLNLNTSQSLSYGVHAATNRSESVNPTTTSVITLDAITTATSLLLLVAVVAMALGRLTSDRFEETLD